MFLFWRVWAVRRAAPLTCELLRRRGRLTAEVAYVMATGVAATEQIAARLLQRMQWDRDPVVASLAASEATLIRVARGDEGEYEIEWSTNPEVVLRELRNRRSRVFAFRPTAPYRFRISKHCQGSYRATQS